MDLLLSYFIALAVLAVLLVLAFKNIKEYVQSCKVALFLKGPPALPILGNMFFYRSKDFLSILESLMQIYKTNITRFWIGPIPLIYLMEPKHIQVILGSSKNSEKSLLYKFMRNFLGRGLTTSNGEKWKSHRKWIQPYFHINVLVQFIEIFSEGANTLVKQMNKENQINVVHFINEMILNVLQEAILGVPMKNYDPSSPFRQGQTFFVSRMIKPWLLLNSIFKYTTSGKAEYEQRDKLYNYTKRLLDKRRVELNEGSSPKVSLLDFFIEISNENPDFTDDGIVNELCTFMLAGQDSVGATLAFSLYYLSKHQDVQERVLEEQRSIFSDGDETLTIQKINRMVYLEQCINETMRLVPSVPIFSRVLTEEVTLDDMRLPKGTNLFISPLTTHKLPHIFPDPRKFDPERFSSENIKKMHPYAFIPFSAGPRICLGYKYAYIEMKTILSIILRNFELSLVPGKEEIQMYFRITIRAKGGIWLNLKPRSK